MAVVLGIAGSVFAQTIVPASAGVGVAIPAYAGASTSVPDSCKTWYDGCNTCTRTYPGGPLACTQVQCIWNAGSKCTAYFDTPSGSVPKYCSYGSSNLRRGARGDVVAAVQEFLQSEGVLSASATGYFGPATERALKAWQSQQGIVSTGSAYTTGWGAVGPRTWAMLKLRCSPIVGGDRDAHGCIGSAGYTWCATKNKCLRTWEESCSPVSTNLSASPTAGPAPLTVTFTAQVNPTNDNLVADAGYYKIVFGDGAEYTFPCTDPSGTCRQPSTAHTYPNAGTYTAQLVHYGYFGMPGQTETIMGTVSIVVGDGGPVACPANYQPVCGRPTGCANTCPPGAFCTMMCRLNDPQTYSNTCMLKNAGAEYLYDGPCIDASSNKPPTISGISGPTTLSVNQSGTWSVTASDPENGTLSYSVMWGDEVMYPMRADAAVSSPVNYQTSTFTHAYASAGTYTVTVTVTDSQGKNAQTTTTVRVGTTPVACTMQYDPVCGQPAEPACRHSYPACLIPTPGPQTYGNRCVLDAAGATFLYTGTCSGTVY